MQINDLTSAESVVFKTYFSHRVVVQFRIRGTKIDWFVFTPKKKILKHCTFFSRSFINLFTVLMQFAFLKRD